MTILVFGFGASNHSLLFLLTMHDVAGGCMKAKGRVKMIQQEREARKINLPFCHLKGNKGKNRYHRMINLELVRFFLTPSNESIKG